MSFITLEIFFCLNLIFFIMFFLLWHIIFLNKLNLKEIKEFLYFSIYLAFLKIKFFIICQNFILIRKPILLTFLNKPR
jgi:hypothetical protein